MLDRALKYQSYGWPVFPVNHEKRPVTLHGFKDAALGEEEARTWWNRWPDYGIAFATGRPSGVWVLDLDGEDGKQAFVGLQEEHGKVPVTVASRTGGGGYHLFFTMPETGDVRNSASQVAPKVDVRGTGGYIVLPPSPHPSGETYQWVTGRDPDSCRVAPAPSWLLELVQSPQVHTSAGERVTLPDQIPEGGGIFGGRDEALFRIGCSLRAKGLSEEAIHAALIVENRDRCVPPLDDATVQQKAAQAAKYEPGTLPTPGLNGNGSRRHSLQADNEGSPNPPMVEVVDQSVLQRIATDKERPVDAVPVPWQQWRRVCLGAGGGQGLARGWHVVIGASSGAGKSLCAANIAAHAVRAGHDTCLVSLEMSQAENVTRLLAIASGTPVKDLEHGSFKRDSWDAASEYFQERAGRFATNPGKVGKLEEIAAIVRQQAEEGYRLIIVDYLQLAWVTGADTLYSQITEVSHVIQGLAKEHRVTTIGLSQVNRRTSSGGAELRKEGLMGGSSLENDAEQVVLLGRPDPQYDGYVSEAVLDKNRHGPQTKWSIRLDAATLQMHQVEK